MENYVSSPYATSNESPPLHKGQEQCQSSFTRSQTNNGNEKDGECVSCHLCAIKVPRRFINEHYKSDEHLINTKIGDVALKRVQKLLHNNIVSDVDETESLYFCPQCVVALNPRDRQNHEKSVVHKKALTVDKFLYDFYVLYANEDEDADIARECEATLGVQCTINNVQSNDVDPVNNISDTSVDIAQIPLQKLMNIPEKIEVKTDDSVGNTVVNSSPLRHDTVNNNYNENKVEPTPSTSNTNQVDKSLFCTFGTNKNQILCKLCKVYVPNVTGNLLSHQKGFKHKEVLRRFNNRFN